MVHRDAYHTKAHDHGDQDVTKVLAIWNIASDEEACGLTIHTWQKQYNLRTRFFK